MHEHSSHELSKQAACSLTTKFYEEPEKYAFDPIFSTKWKNPLPCPVCGTAVNFY
jgi:hypothetical protein